MKQPRMSPCHGLTVIRESIWLNLPGHRKEIGTVDLCSLVTCQKPVSDVRGEINGWEWVLMQRYHPHPPYYFVKTECGLLPETAPKDAWKKKVQVDMSGQDRATAECDPREDDI